MKPLLLDILACPICKYYPLELNIFKWETSESKFVDILKAFHDKDMNYLTKSTKIRRGKDRIDDAIIITKEDLIQINDEMVREKSGLIDYLIEVEKKLENFKYIEDHTDENFSSCLSIIKEDSVKRILETKAKLANKKLEEILLKDQNEMLDSIISDIYLLNWFFIFSEIEEGMIHCEKCNRWYPIIETIPQMLPDDLRERDAEIDFLNKWKNKLTDNIKEKGKPFNLR